jgi:prephenate dehydrogenase
MPETRTKRITIVGLGRTGTYLATGLRRELPDLQVIGHDRDSDVAKAAQKAGLVHKAHWNLISACDGAGVILLAIPADEAMATLAVLAGEVSPGAIISDTASLKAALVRWAEENLPQGVHYVGGHLLQPACAEPARGEPERAVHCLTPTAATDPSAVSLIAGLFGRLGARVIFIDPEEHDALMVGLQHLPGLAMAAVLRSLEVSEAGADLARLHEALPTQAVSLAERSEAMLGLGLTPANRDALLLWLDRYAAVLVDLRRRLQERDREADKRLREQLVATREHWLAQAGRDPDANPRDSKADGSPWRRMLGMR